MPGELQSAAQLLCRAGIDALAALGEAHAIEAFGMIPAPFRYRHIDGWVGDRRLEVKAKQISGRDFFGKITRWDKIDDVLFVGVNSSTFEVEHSLWLNAGAARALIETQAPSYWCGKEPVHWLTERLFRQHAEQAAEFRLR